MVQLCDLPDDILYEIFGFLPMEEIARTCIVSRRWEHLWKSATYVRFNRWVRNSSDLLHTIYGSRDPSVPIQSFSLLNIEVDDSNAQRIQHFLRSTTLAIQALEIGFMVRCTEQQLPFTVPASMFRSETLENLHIYTENRETAIMELSESFYLPRLRLLSLHNLRVPNMERLLNCCPLLEGLSIRGFLTSDNTKVAITICNPNLKKVTFNYLTPPLRLHNCDRLETFFFGGHLIHELVLTGRRPKNLQNVTMKLGHGSSLIHALKLLNCLSTTKKLSIHGGRRFQDLSTLKVEALLGLSRFDNLVELGLYGFDMEPLLDTMLNKAPCVQFLQLQEFNWIVTSPPFSLPPFLPNQLTKIIISFKILNHAAMVKKLLQIGQVLEEVVIEILDPEQWERNNSVKPEQLLEMVKKLPKASENCRISLF